MIAAKKQMIFSGSTIGLLGGSFDPPHAGHVHITNQALQTFNLQKVWWLVSSGNPHKEQSSASFEFRFNECKKINKNPRVVISDIEKSLNTPFTAEVLWKINAIYPSARFLWLMGADNLVNFHKWQNWTWIIENIPIGVMARPGDQIKAGLSQAALRYRKFRVKPSNAGLLPFLAAPAWSLLGGPMRTVSSTQIRLGASRQ